MNNLSNSTLRRKLFEGLLDDDNEQPDNNEIEKCPYIPNIDNDSKSFFKKTEPQIETNREEELDSPRNSKQYRKNNSGLDSENAKSADKENKHPIHNVNITPGAIMLTPTAKSVGPTPDRSVSYLIYCAKYRFKD